MIKYKKGNLLEDTSEALVNTVNTVEEIVNLELLYQLGRDLFRADNRIKMEELIEAAIEKQKQKTNIE